MVDDDHREAREPATRRRGTTFFSAVPTAAEVEAGKQYLSSVRTAHERSTDVRDVLDDQHVGELVQARLLVDEGPVHLTEVKMAPGMQVPRHRHAVDQVVFIARGSIWQGNRELGPGSGFFTPAGSAYAFRVGSEGVTLHEFFVGDVQEWAAEIVDG